MDSLIQLRKTVGQVLQAQIHGYWMETLQEQLIQSKDLNRFIVVRTGWYQDADRYALIQDIKLLENGMLVIYADNTDRDIAEELIEAGVPADKVIKAYDPDQVKRLAHMESEQPYQNSSQRMAA